MTKNPYINALAALAYIAAIVSVLFYGPGILDGTQETVLIPMAMLSLFVFSAAVMGYLFLYQPIVLFLEGSKKEAVTLFLSTAGAFGGITLLLFIAQVLVARLGLA